MFTARRKIQKDKGLEPTEFEETVAQAFFDLENNNQELKSDLKDLYINSAVQMDVAGNRKAVVVHIPYRLRKAYRKIHVRLVRELEKKFSGKDVILIATRRILRPPKKGSAVVRPRSRTLTTVHDATLEDVVYPAEIVGKRVRYRLDGSKIIKTIEKLEKMVEDGNCYAAQQVYKSSSARYIDVQKYSEALDILQAGTLIQLKHGQVTCGAELAVLFVETLLKGKLPYSEETMDRLRKIYQGFPKIPLSQKLVDDDDDDDMQKLSEALMAAKLRVESCSSFLKAAIRWSAEFGAHKNGSPQLHDMLAEYLFSESPELCYPGEDDAAIARAVLLYLSQGNMRDANYLMDELKRQLESKQFDFPCSDLSQFIEYLLWTLERDAFPLLKILRQKYKPSINWEPLFDELLDEIAEKFYGVRRRSGLQGIFGDLLKMM